MALLPSRNLDFAEFAVPILTLGIVAEAVLVVQFFGDLIEGGFEFIDALDFQHAAAGGLGKLPETVFIKDVEHVASVVARELPTTRELIDSVNTVAFIVTNMN